MTPVWTRKRFNFSENGVFRFYLAWGPFAKRTVKSEDEMQQKAEEVLLLLNTAAELKKNK